MYSSITRRLLPTSLSITHLIGFKLRIFSAYSNPELCRLVEDIETKASAHYVVGSARR